MKTMQDCAPRWRCCRRPARVALAGPEVVAGPGADPACFAPWSAETKYLQWAAKEGPYRIAVVNGFVGNTWRIQMIKTAKAYAEDPAIKDKIEEFKVVSTGTDAPAQLGAIEDFINQGFDAIVTIAVSPEGFDRVIRLADRKNVVIVPFDNVLDTDAVMMVNEDQLEMGRNWAQFAASTSSAAGQDRRQDPRGPRPARQLGRPRPLDRHPRGASTPPAATGRSSRSSATGTTAPRRRSTADAIAVHGQFDGVITQGGSTGTVQAMIDAGHPFVPVAGEAENGFRKLDRRALRRGPQGPLDRPVARPRRHLDEGGDLGARGQPDAAADLGAAADRRLHRRSKDGENFWSDLPDNFFTVNEFPPCGVNISGPAIMAQTEADM